MPVVMRARGLLGWWAKAPRWNRFLEEDCAEEPAPVGLLQHAEPAFLSSCRRKNKHKLNRNTPLCCFNTSFCLLHHIKNKLAMLDSKVCFRMIALNLYDVLYLLVDCNTSAQPTEKQSQELIWRLVKIFWHYFFPTHFATNFKVFFWYLL